MISANGAERWMEGILMSVSLWAYCPSYCDGDFCPGDCDHCPKADEIAETVWEEEDEEDGI